MTYNALIDKIMPEVNSGSTEPIMIYRDIHGSWHGDFMQNQYGDTFDWVEDIQDPFALRRHMRVCTQSGITSTTSAAHMLRRRGLSTPWRSPIFRNTPRRP